MVYVICMVVAAICWIWPVAIPAVIFIIFLFIYDLEKGLNKKTKWMEWVERRIYNLSAETWVLYGRTEPPPDDFPPFYPLEDRAVDIAIHKENKNRKKWEYEDRDYFLEEIYGRKPKKRDILDDEENEQDSAASSAASSASKKPENKPGKEPDNQP